MVKKTRPQVTDYWWSCQMATLHNLQQKVNSNHETLIAWCQEMLPYLMAWNFNSAIDQTAQLAKVHLKETPSKGKAVSLYACSMIAIWDNSCKTTLNFMVCAILM